MACSPLMSKDSVTVPSFHPAVAPDVTKQPRMSWLLGHRPAVRVAVQDVLSAIVAYVVGSILLCIGGAHGIIPVWISVSLISAYIVCWGTVYVLVRSGWSQRLADPHLTFVRVFIDLGAMTLAHALVPIVRGATLQLLCAMMAFYMGRLNQRQILGTSFMAVCLMLATLLGLWLTQPEHITLSVEILNLVMCSVLLPIAGFVGGEVYRIYQRSAAQRDQLQLTLTQLNHLSTRDSLTDLANRRHMLTLLDEEIRRQRRNGQTFCIGLLDIDLFKLVNDTHGHPVGDQVLKGFANLATRSIGAADTLARWGGEEFLLLLPVDNLDQAHDALTQLHEAVRRHDWTQYAPDLQLTFSAGLAEHDQHEPLDALLERADRALYRAKQLGRDRTELAIPATSHTDDVPMQSFEPAAPRPCPDAPPPRTSTRIAHPAWAAPTLDDAPPSNTGWRDNLSTIVMGHHLDMRDRVRLMLAAMLGFGFWVITLHLYAIPQGLMPAELGYFMIAYMVLSTLGCYALIRSGVTRAWRDPQIAQGQLINACLIGVVCYLHAPALRAVLLQSMCVVLIFGMVSLRPRQTRVVGITAIALMMGVLLWQLALPPANINLTSEGMKVALACFIFLQISVFSYNASRLRSLMLRERGVLTKAVETVQDLLVHDTLTGLYNRTHLMSLLERERQRAICSQRPFCVAMIDLDHFKRINDSHGHQVGDAVLIEFAQLSRDVLRDIDVMGRWGGEEFLVILPDTEPGPQCLMGLERLRERFASHTLPGHPGVHMSFSCGVADFRPDDTLAHTLQRADQALYAAKNAGRNRCMLAH